MAYWLFKSEPGAFSFEDLKESPRGTTSWEGIRNYQARNLIRDRMKKGDGVLFYHSSTAVPAVMGTATIVREAYPDDAQFEPGSRYVDPKSDPAAPRWWMVDIRFEKGFEQPVTLSALREERSLAGMELLRKGNRLSVQPVRAREWRRILRLGE